MSPAAERNKAPILEVLERVLPPAGLVLEIASGTGQHVVHFAQALEALRWQPSDPEAQHRRSIAAWTAACKVENVAPPIDLDVHDVPWRVPVVDAVVCINLIHIAPWTAAAALFAGASTALGEQGVVYLYGPYRLGGRHTAPSNEAFDRALRRQNPQWGVRDRDEVAQAANDHGFELVEAIAMPANNLSLVFRRR